MLASDHDASVWRPSWLMRAFVLAGVALAIALGLSIIRMAAEEGAIWEAAAFVTVSVGLPQILVLRYAFRSRIEIRDDSVRVVTLFGERSLSWQEINGAEPGYNGMALFLANGEVVLSGAVQKNNVSAWLNRRTRADDLADLIRHRAAGVSA